MPSIITFYVIAPHRLPAVDAPADRADALRRHGARWAAVESNLIGFLDACDEVGRRIGSPVVSGALGVVPAAKTRAIFEALAGATPDELGAIEADASLARAFSALRDTAEEATKRSACMVVESVG
jgi:hypothetical protein